MWSITSHGLQKNFNPEHIAGVLETEPSAYAKNGSLWRTLPATYDVNEARLSALEARRIARRKARLTNI